MTRIAAEALYVQLGRLVESMPDLTVQPMPASTMQWLGRAHALVTEAGNTADAVYITHHTGHLHSSRYAPSAARDIAIIVHRALATAEVRAPVTAQGAFVPAGTPFDAFSAVGKVLSAAKVRLMIVDPYLDEKVLTDFAPQAAEGIALCLLADQNSVKSSLKPAVVRWSAQYGAKRQLEAKLAPPRALHDRLIIVDGNEAWDLTQSLNGFAARSPASIVRSGAEQAALKIPYYEGVWASAAAI